MDRVVKTSNPELIDKSIQDLQDSIASNILWLTHIFGKAQLLVRERDKKKYYYPGLYLETERYIDLTPTNEYGNFCFFFLEDSQTVSFEKNRFNVINSKLSIIFWFNIDSINSVFNRNIEQIKKEILSTLTRNTTVKDGRFSVNQISEQAKNIYKEFDLQEIDTQFLMQPYAGLRIDGDLIFKENGVC